MMLFAEWTPEQINSLVSAIMTGLLAIVGAITAYLLKRQTNRIETKTDQQTEVLKQQDLTLSTVSQTAKEIKADVKQAAADK
jgi:hypothetical protein